MRIVLFKSLSHCWEILRAKTRAQDDVAGELQFLSSVQPNTWHPEEANQLCVFDR